MKTNKKFKLIHAFFYAFVLFLSINPSKMFCMDDEAGPANAETPTATQCFYTQSLVSADGNQVRIAYLNNVIGQNPILLEQFRKICSLRELFLLHAFHEAKIRNESAQKKVTSKLILFKEIIERKKQIKQKTIEILEQAETAYFESNTLVQELIDRIEITAQIKLLTYTLPGIPCAFKETLMHKNPFFNQFTYTNIKRIVSREFLSKEKHLKYLFSKQYLQDTQLVQLANDSCFFGTFPYLSVVHSSSSCLLARANSSIFSLEHICNVNPNLGYQILRLLAQARCCFIKRILIEKIDEFCRNQVHFTSSAQRKIHENKVKKLQEIKPKILKSTYSEAEGEVLTNQLLSSCNQSIKEKVIFLMEQDIQTSINTILSSYFYFIKDILRSFNFRQVEFLNLSPKDDYDLENIATLDLENLIFNNWLKEITKPEVQTQDAPATKIEQPNQKETGSRKHRKRKKKPKVKKEKPKQQSDDTEKQESEEEQISVQTVASTTPAKTVQEDAPLAPEEAHHANTTPQQPVVEPIIIEEPCPLPFLQQEDPSISDDVIIPNTSCILDMHRGTLNGHQIKIFVYPSQLPCNSCLLSNLDYSFLEQHGKIGWLKDNNHSFSRLVETNFGHLGQITEVTNFTREQAADITARYGGEYQHQVTIHIPGRLAPLTCPIAIGQALNPNGVFEFTILQRNPEDSNGLCIHRFFRPNPIAQAHH